MIETAEQKKEREHREDLQRLRGFRPIDDDFMRGMFQDDLGKLMHDFNCTDAKDMYFEIMADRTRYLKENPEGVETMCKVMEDMRDQAREEGRTEGKAEGMNLFAALIRKLTEMGRTDDIEKAAMDANYRKQLLAEFALR